MNELTIFNNDELGSVRTVVENDTIYFCLLDVCRILGLEQVTRVRQRLNQDGVTISKVIDGMGREQGATFVNESNLYKVIFQSRKPEAEKFTDWITSEVLPQIRKTGNYSIMDKSALSPQLQLSYSILEGLASVEMKQKQLETKVDNICDIFTQTIGDWKEEINSKVREIAQKSNCDYKVLWNQLYGELECRAKCSLDRLVKNKKKRLELQGLTKTAIEKQTTKLAVIYDNQRIKEIFTTIVKEFAIKYCA